MTFEEIGISGIKNTGKTYITCPKCKESRKRENKNKLCLTVNNDIGNRWWKCWNCSYTGNLDTMEKLSVIKEKARMPAEIPIVYSELVQKFLFKKKITPFIAKEQKLYELNGYLAFPVFYKNNICNVKFRNLRFGENEYPKFYQLSKKDGAMSVFSGLDDIDTDKKEIIITEGETDKLTWLSAGYENVISVPQGAPAINAKNFSDEFAYVSDPYFQSFIEKMDKFILATDGDVAGTTLATHLARLIGKEKCFTLKYPEGYKDANQIWAGDEEKGLPELGQKGIEALYDSMKVIPIKGIIELTDVSDDMARIRKTGFLPGYGTGNPQIDKLFTLKAPYLYGNTGVFGNGKSTWLRWYLTEVVKRNRIKLGIFAPESRPAFREFIKYIEAYSGKTYVENDPDSISEDQLEATKEIINTYFKFINPSSSNFEDFRGAVSQKTAKTFKSLFSYLKHLVLTEGINGYVIDPWNTVDHERGSKTDHDYLADALMEIHEFNDKYDLFSIIVAHPTKEVRRKDNGNYHRPSIYNMSGGMGWGNKLDIGFITHREPYVSAGRDENGVETYVYSQSVHTEVTTEKIKVEELGNNGMSVKFMMESNRASFRLLNPEIIIDNFVTPISTEFDTPKDDTLPF